MHQYWGIWVGVREAEGYLTIEKKEPLFSVFAMFSSLKQRAFFHAEVALLKTVRGTVWVGRFRAGTVT